MVGCHRLLLLLLRLYVVEKMYTRNRIIRRTDSSRESATVGVDRSHRRDGSREDRQDWWRRHTGSSPVVLTLETMTAWPVGSGVGAPLVAGGAHVVLLIEVPELAVDATCLIL